MSYQTIQRTSPTYPKRLLELVDPPASLFIQGDASLLNHTHCCAIVGSRRMTEYGKRVVASIIPHLVHHGIPIVSGLAFGVDAYAHELTVAQGGSPIAVLGSGIKYITPVSNESLGRSVARQGCLVSEYPDRTVAQKYYFPARNRIIAGLSKALIVVEGTETSGSLITADFMLQLGRDVFAVPGQIDAPLSAGPNLLLANGAHVLRSAQDILLAFGIDSAQGDQILSQTSDQEQLILSCLEASPHSFDELCQACTLTQHRDNALLTELEMKRLISRSASGSIHRT